MDYQWSEFMRTSVVFTTVAALALIALASPAAAYHGTVDVDECGDAPTNGGDGCAKPQDEDEVLGIELVD